MINFKSQDVILYMIYHLLWKRNEKMNAYVYKYTDFSGKKAKKLVIMVSSGRENWITREEK